MKKLTTLLLFFIAMSAASQVPAPMPIAVDSFLLFTIDTSSLSTWQFGYCEDTSCVWISSNNKGTVRIEGDTMKAIAGLMKNIHQRDSIIEILYHFMGATINYLNQLPDYWRTKQGNCKWPQMYAALKKNGYGIVKRKTAVYKPGCK
jgi:hypothetical protein